MTKLVLQQGGTVYGEYPLLKPVVTIGRKPDNDLRIDNLAVSGHHARVVRDGDRFTLEDLGSTNGTFIGARRIKAQQLADGMEITIGKYTLRFVAEAAKTEGGDQATVFIAPTVTPARAQTTQRVTHSHGAHREQSDSGGRMVMIVLAGVAAALAVFGVLLWFTGLL